MVSNGVIDNGVFGYSDLPPINPGNILTCSDTTVGAGTMFFQGAEFIGYPHVQTLTPRFGVIDRSVAHFIISTVRRATENRYSYGKKFNRQEMANTVIKLPCDPDGRIDYEFMRAIVAELEARRVAELEARRVAELEAYLKATGLSNTTLTADEQQALHDLENGGDRFTAWRFADVFENIQQGKRVKKSDQQPGSIPFVMAGTTNNGVVGHIANPVAMFPGNSITVDIFGNTFYRKDAYGAGDDTGAYWDNARQYSEDEMLFFATAMQVGLAGQFDYGNKLRSSKSHDLVMELPVADGHMDRTHMCLVISAVKKTVIRGVMDFIDREIAATRRVISSSDG